MTDRRFELPRFLAQVPPYKRVAAVHLVEALPRTPAGKLLRLRLEERLSRA